MELIVFDLDGTLLNADSVVSTYTQDTLRMLSDRGILYTVATGRTLHGARDLLAEHRFVLPQAYKNGVMIWCPKRKGYTQHLPLALHEVHEVLSAMRDQGLSPFIFTLEAQNHHVVYHPPLKTSFEHKLAESYRHCSDVVLQPLSQLPNTLAISNISALGPIEAIQAVERRVHDAPHLVAFAGEAFEGQNLWWIDIHHGQASKGNAVEHLRQQLGISRVLCFGDSDNDLSMFTIADEAYAPSNAKADVRAAATAVIGHHDEDGIARFLRQRFGLPA